MLLAGASQGSLDRRDQERREACLCRDVFVVVVDSWWLANLVSHRRNGTYFSGGLYGHNFLFATKDLNESFPATYLSLLM